MKTLDQLKKSLEYMSITDVEEKMKRAQQGLPYAYVEEVAANALACIQQLDVKCHQLELERNAAVKDLMQSKNSHCPFCKNWRKPEKYAACFKCQFGGENRFEWHGVQEEDMK